MSDPAHKATDRIIAKIEKELAEQYKQASEEVFAKMDDYLRRYAIKDRKWREWVANGKKTPLEYRQWATGQVMMGKRWEELKDTLAQDYVNVHRIAESTINGYAPEVYAINHNYATFEVEKGSLVDTSYSLYSRESVERLWRENPKIYKRPGAKIQQDIRDGLIKRWSKQQIQSVITQGILQGESIPHLTQRLESVTGGEHRAAIRNARTMMTGVQNAGRMDAFARANEMGIRTMKTWIATLDNRTRHWHRQLDGVTIPVDEKFENEMGEIMFPGDPDADGANIYNCRCTLIANIKKIDATDLNLRNDSKLGKMTYEEWKSKHGISQPITAQERKSNMIKQSYIAEYRDG